MTSPRMLLAAAFVIALVAVAVHWQTDRSEKQDVVSVSSPAPVPAAGSSIQTPAVVEASPPLPTSAASPWAHPAASAAAQKPVAEQEQELRYKVLTVLQSEPLLAYQTQLEAWTCQDRACSASLRVPVTTPAGAQGNAAAAADLMNAVRRETKDSGAEVALLSVGRGKEGVAVKLSISVPEQHGRFYTDEEIAEIRAQTLQAYIEQQEGKKK